MTHFAKFSPFALLGLCLLVAASGCSKSSALDAKALASHRARLALGEEPDNVQTVVDVRETLLGGSHEGHDHDGDGHQDHAAEDHDDADHAAHDQDAQAHNAHAHDEHDHAGHDHAEHAQATEPQDVAMVGHIGGLANPWGKVQPDYPFAKSQAVFFLADPQAVIEIAEAGHAHAPGEECAFCAAHAADKADQLAMVQCVDDRGKVLPTDVRQLFDVKENDTVVVRGKAHVTAGGILVVDAEGLYIRK